MLLRSTKNFLTKFIFLDMLLYLLVLPFLHFILLNLFSSEYYFFYFLILLMSIFYGYKYGKFLEIQLFVKISLVWFTSYIFYSYCEDYFYDFYIDYNFSYQLVYINEIIAYSLLFVHLLIVLLLGYNKRKKF